MIKLIPLSDGTADRKQNYRGDAHRKRTKK